MNEYFDKSPLDILELEEYDKILLNYCSFICILQNKKMNMPSIFVTILDNEVYFEAYKQICGFDDDREAILSFLKYDYNIVKSKFLKKIINKSEKKRDSMFK